MAIIKIPLRNDIPAYEFKVDLDGTTYTMKIRYNTRAGIWAMSLLTENDEAIISSVPLLLGVIFLKIYQDVRMPQGNMFLLNVEDENVEATRDSLSENVFLLYEEAD